MNHPTQPPGQARYLNGNPVSVIATDYGGTISLNRLDHVLGQKPVDPAAAAALRILHDLGMRLVLASNTQPNETRWPALAKAGIDDLFKVVLPSYALGVRKPDPLFYKLVIAAAEAPPGEVLFVGDRTDYDVAEPLAHGMQAVLVRPGGILRPGEAVPAGVRVISHFSELPALLETR